MAESITVDPGTSFQTFKGWEMNQNVGNIEFPASFPNWESEIIDAVVALGINRVRTELLSGLIENTTDYYQAFLTNNEDVVNDTTPTEWADIRAHRRVPVNDDSDPDNVVSSGFKWSYWDRQIDTVIEPMKAALAANGETLFWSVCFVHFSTSNQLHVDDPDEYGELMKVAWQHCNSTYGYVPDALEIYLEPDNGSCQVTEAELAAMIIAAVDAITGAGFAKPYIIAPSMTVGGNAEAYYDNIKSANATAAGYIDEISYHRYGTPPNTTELASLRTKALADGKNTSMIEWIGATISELYEDLRYARVSAWQQFVGAFPEWKTTDNGGQYFLIETSPSFAVLTGDRTYYLQHYFKYIRAGAVMKDTTDSSGSYQSVAFENADGTYAVVIKCAGSQDLTVSGLPAGTYSIRYTLGDGSSTPSAIDQALTDQVIGTGEDVVFTMPGAGVVSIFQTEIPAPDPATYYADPAGTPGGDGSIGDPWDLQTLLDFEPDVNHELIVKDGTYTGKFVSARTAGNFHMEHRVPGSVTIDAFVWSTLVGGIDSDDTSLTLADATGFFIHTDELCIDQEVLKGGTFTGNTLNGISVRGASGTIGVAASHADGAIVSMVGNAFYITGTDTVYDFAGSEILYSDTRRLKDDISGLTRGNGVHVIGQRNTVLNVYAHDCGNGIFSSAASEDTNWEGVLSTNNGIYDTSPDGNGHGFYLENNAGICYVHNCLSLNNFNLGCQGYGATPESAFVGGHFQRSVFANNGSPLGIVDPTVRNFNCVIGPADVPSPSVTVTFCDFFHPHDLNGSNINVGYGEGVEDATVTFNYVVGGANGVLLSDPNDTMVLTGSDNVVYTRYVGAQYMVSKDNGYDWNGNTYYDASGRTVFGIVGSGLYDFADWKINTGYDSGSSETASDMPDTVIIHTTGNSGGYANISIYAPSNPSTIDINMSGVAALEHGQAFELRNSFDFLGDVVYSGVHDENNPIITIDLTGAILNVAEPIGLGYTPPTTMPDFGSLVVVFGSTGNDIIPQYSFSGLGVKKLFLIG